MPLNKLADNKKGVSMLPIEPTDLEIHVHLIGGQVHSYFEDKPKHVKDLLTHARSGNLFLQTTLLFAGTNCVAAYRPPSVWRIDVIPRPLPDWLNQTEARGVDLRELRESEFNGLAEATHQADDKGLRASEAFVALMEIGAPDNSRMFLQIRGLEPVASEQRQVLKHLFSLPTFRCRRLGGGTTLLNPHSFSHCTFRLDLPVAPTTAWHAERICS
jgi:hypothetical protein